MPDTNQTLCDLLRQLLWVSLPANAAAQLRYTQGPVAGAAFGAGGQNLQVVQGGNARSTQVTPIPPNVRSILIRNLSLSTTLLYWHTDSKSPPADAYSTIPSSGAVAIDVRADVTPALYVMPDPSASDAGVEVSFYYYDPTKAPGPVPAPFQDP